jgi:hypothetical protein
MIPFVIHKDLCFMLKASETGGMNNAVPVSLIAASAYPFRFRE